MSIFSYLRSRVLDELDQRTKEGKMMTFTNETLEDYMAEWRRKIHEHQEREKRMAAYMRYDPVTKTYY